MTNKLDFTFFSRQTLSRAVLASELHNTRHAIEKILYNFYYLMTLSDGI